MSISAFIFAGLMQIVVLVTLHFLAPADPGDSQPLCSLYKASFLAHRHMGHQRAAKVHQSLRCKFPSGNKMQLFSLKASGKFFEGKTWIF